MLSPDDSEWVETPKQLFNPRSAGPTVQRLVLGPLRAQHYRKAAEHNV